MRENRQAENLDERTLMNRRHVAETAIVVANERRLRDRVFDVGVSVRFGGDAIFRLLAVCGRRAVAFLLRWRRDYCREFGVSRRRCDVLLLVLLMLLVLVLLQLR